jgi:hypothetical protein
MLLDEIIAIVKLFKGHCLNCQCIPVVQGQMATLLVQFCDICSQNWTTDHYLWQQLSWLDLKRLKEASEF